MISRNSNKKDLFILVSVVIDHQISITNHLYYGIFSRRFIGRQIGPKEGYIDVSFFCVDGINAKTIIGNRVFRSFYSIENCAGF